MAVLRGVDPPAEDAKFLKAAKPPRKLSFMSGQPMRSVSEHAGGGKQLDEQKEEAEDEEEQK